MEEKEKAKKYEQVVSMENKRGIVAIKKPNSDGEVKEFNFDAVYDWK